MNTTNEGLSSMAPSLSRTHLAACCFTSLPQAVTCANKFFMQGLNAQIVARDGNAFLVVSPDVALQMLPQGFQLLYGD